MDNNIRKPNFFIVGAPKCGTTALYSYLGEHPEIFIPDTSNALETVLGGKKELHFFGSDLKFKHPSLEEYLSYFSGAKEEKRLGESSVFYLYSQKAAMEIKSFQPEAKIIVMLRNPIDMIYSWHSQLLFWGDEDITDFKSALDAEADRKQGLRYPRRHDHPIECLFYREIAKVSEQLSRYFDVFGRENVQAIIFDDFKHNISKVYQETLGFLDVSLNFLPEFEVINANKTVRSRALQNLTRRPPSTIRNIVKMIMPSELRGNIRSKLLQMNIQNTSRTPLNKELYCQLQDEFLPEVEQLSLLLGRDLTHWVKDKVAA